MDNSIRSMIFAKNREGCNGKFYKSVQTRIDAKTRDENTGELTDTSAWEYASMTKPTMDEAIKDAQKKQAIADEAKVRRGEGQAKGMQMVADRAKDYAVKRATEHDAVMDDIKSQPADPHELEMYHLRTKAQKED